MALDPYKSGMKIKPKGCINRSGGVDPDSISAMSGERKYSVSSTGHIRLRWGAATGSVYDTGER
jgi:hypothetical protein